MPYQSVAELPAFVRKLQPTQQRQWMAVWNDAYKRCVAKGGTGTACESSAFAQANGVVKGAEQTQLSKNNLLVNYQQADGEDTCGNCVYFTAGSCALVEGPIREDAVCDLWAAEGVQMVEQTSPPFQLFIEAKGLSSASEWVPYLPTPGKYQHPRYGTVEVTPEMNQQLVDSIVNRVYQDHIPMDAEHETKLSGALAWITGARMNANGSADAQIDMTPRGKALVDSGQFKYISPEWFSTWTDPATGQVHKNIAAGGAFTTRPFFKDKVLRALVATEAGIEVDVAPDAYWFREFSTEQRIALAKEGKAIPVRDSSGEIVDGAYPIENEADLSNAIHAVGRASNRAEAMAHIKKRAQALGATGLLPQGWSEEFAQPTGGDLHAEGPMKNCPNCDKPMPAGTKTCTNCGAKMTTEPTATLTMAEVEAKIAAAREEAAKEFKEQVDGLQTKLTAAETLAASEKTAREGLQGQITSLTQAARRVRFTEMISASDKPWGGDKDGNISVLEAMADQFGEDSDVFKKHVEQQQAIAAQLAESALFKELGTAASGNGSDPERKLDQLARKVMAEDAKLSYEAAYSRVMETPEGRKLYSDIPSH